MQVEPHHTARPAAIQIQQIKHQQHLLLLTDKQFAWYVHCGSIKTRGSKSFINFAIMCKY